MKRELQQRESEHYGQNQGGADRSDWVSKYLELADKMIQTHMPPQREAEEA
jgi:hypothetical protein